MALCVVWEWVAALMTARQCITSALPDGTLGNAKAAAASAAVNRTTLRKFAIADE
jgi:hypothetical protein